MSDEQTRVAQLRQTVREFVTARDWQQFHSPKNLSMALAIEAAELMEHFQWISADASCQIGSDAAKLKAVSDELADIFCYTLALANELNIDLSSALHQKMRKNEAKYPADQFRGRYGYEDSGR